MKVEVDFEKCQSNAICMRIAPTIFEVREDGYLYVLNDTPDEELRETLIEAVESCPTQALSIIG
ncbi:MULTISPECIES: ferredoxin [Acidithrix]|uniref:Ferredoxin-2 n=2 Tax=root TaxID=1 RepID=A0A0D8HIQ3_9ACTN|nr:MULTISPECIES: ferredoxin [Acidithrix]KJF17823.1 ferredoxin-2 [Acidithrix ferrooxidans]CAG4925041.1 unnamed protein product [Acidithrix sp. C25]